MDNQSGINGGNNHDKPYIRHVVIEPPKPPITALKQYVVLRDFRDGNLKGKKDEMVLIQANEATVLLAQNFVMPLSVAIRQGVYPPKKDDSFVGKMKHIASQADERPVAETLKESTETLQEASKKLLGNKLRDIVQGRQQEIEPKPDADQATIAAEKLEAIKSGGKK